MKVKCLHGYFIFTETRVGQISDFMSMTGLEIVPFQDFYTFADLEDALKYSIAGATYLGNVATATFEGHVWEVFEANGLIYNFNTGSLVPISSITQVVEIKNVGNKFVSGGLILPGSVKDDGSRVRDYAAWYSRDTQKWSYTEVTYV